MSWDVLLLKFPESAASPEEMPKGYRIPAIGSRAEVVAALRKLFRGAEGNASGLTVERRSFTMEIDTGDSEPCRQLLLQIRLDHDKARQAILRIAEHFQIRTMDCSTGEFISAASGASFQERQDEQRSRRLLQEQASNPIPRAQEPLAGLTEERCVLYFYLRLDPGESPNRQQKSVYGRWRRLFKEHGEQLAFVLGPSWVLKSPNGEWFCDYRVVRYPALVTETEEEMVPRVELGAKLFREFAMATGRRTGRIEQGSVFVSDDGRRFPLAECAYQRLWTNADYAMQPNTARKS